MCANIDIIHGRPRSRRDSNAVDLPPTTACGRLEQQTPCPGWLAACIVVAALDTSRVSGCATVPCLPRLNKLVGKRVFAEASLHGTGTAHTSRLPRVTFGTIATKCRSRPKTDETIILCSLCHLNSILNPWRLSKLHPYVTEFMCIPHPKCTQNMQLICNSYATHIPAVRYPSPR